MELKLNRLLAALAIAVLIATLWLLAWLRQNAAGEIHRVAENAAALLRRDEILFGPGGDTLVRFRRLRALMEQTRQSSSYINNAVLTKIVGGREHPIYPISFWADHRDGWAGQLAKWQREPLGDPGAPWGYIYLDLNRSTLTFINVAIWAVAISVMLMLVALLARVLSQESSLKRTVIELNDRRRELIRLERLALGGQLAAGILHDLRKPILNIRHSLDDLSDALGDFSGAATGLQNVRHQTMLFFQILQESQIERFVQSDRAGEEFVNIGPILEFSLNLVRYERRAIEVERKDTPGLPPILAHPYRLVQLFSNLILNAYQAMKGQGRLTIETTAGDGSTVVVRITDSGPGIPPEALDRIFDPFYTTKPEGEGTGLGLSICRMIVEELGGTISVESKPGGPTAFTVKLPAEQER
ncbi:HAMP domain-containing histidine kinase [bacterium]|nr:HAMP domain-containing histidine kinase [bacterium]